MVESDAAAVAQVRAGESEAFRVLVERHSASLFRLAYRMTRNEQDAQDVVQETFLRAYRQLHRFEERAGFGTWLYRIGVNCALDLMRSRQRRTELPVGNDPDERSPLDVLAAHAPGADRLVYSAEVKQRLAAAMARLTPNERAAFTLRHFEGMSSDEIARTLGLRSNAAKNTIFRAVQKLREALEPVVSTVR